MVPVEKTLENRLVVVPADRLDDLLELSRLAADRIPESDDLGRMIRSTAADIRQRALLEP
jgi:hypothetical protein